MISALEPGRSGVKLAKWLKAAACVAALAAGMHPAGAAETIFKRDVEGRALNFVIPEGYCMLDRANPNERHRYNELTKANEGRNVVVVIFADCGQLAAFRKNAESNLTRHGYYALVLADKRLVTWAPDYSRAKYLGDLSPYVAKLNGKSVEDAVTKVATLPLKGKPGFVNLGMLDRNDDGIYTGTGVTYEVKGTLSRVNTVSATTLIKGIVVSAHLYDNYTDGKNYLKLLDQQRQLAARLVAANK